MTEFLCLACMTWCHDKPECAHNPLRACLDCGRAVGYRATNDAGGTLGSPFRCWRCNWRRAAT